jgi:hypothetical protein
MSKGLLKAATLHRPYLQSPVNDLWSFYYVAQWAAVFNKTKFSGTTNVPATLTDLRLLIAGSSSDRALGTREVTDPGLDRAEYGHFLADCSCVLREWEWTLRQLAADWKVAKVDELMRGIIYKACHPHFRSFTNRGVLELLQLVQKYFPDTLSRLE